MWSGPVSVTVPGDARYVGIVRTVASSVASLAGMGVDRIDDLALAVDEACTVLVASGRPPAVEGTLDPSGHRISVTIAVGRVADRRPWPPEDWAGSLGARVLEATTGGVRFGTADGGQSVSFTVG